MLLAVGEHRGEDCSEHDAGRPSAWEPATDRHARIDEQLTAEPLFVGLSKKHLRRISSLMTRIERPARQVLATQGQAGCEFFIALEGEVEVQEGDRDSVPCLKS